jgi:hypothetical protein
MDLIFAIQANDRECFVSRMEFSNGILCQSNGRRTMLRKTMIAFAKTAAFVSGLSVEQGLGLR